MLEFSTSITGQYCQVDNFMRFPHPLQGMESRLRVALFSESELRCISARTPVLSMLKPLRPLIASSQHSWMPVRWKLVHVARVQEEHVPGPKQC